MSNIGRLRHRVIIQKATSVRDGHGGTVRTFATWKKRWASVENGVGREFVRAKAVHTNMTDLVRMRFLEGLNAEHRLVFKGRTLNIESIVDHNERERYFDLVCVEKK